MKKSFSIFLIIVSIMIFFSFLSCKPDTDIYYEMTAQEFKNYAPANETIDYDSINYGLLNAAIFHDTNIIRQENSQSILEHSQALE